MILLLHALEVQVSPSAPGPTPVEAEVNAQLFEDSIATLPADTQQVVARLHVTNSTATLPDSSFPDTFREQPPSPIPITMSETDRTAAAPTASTALGSDRVPKRRLTGDRPGGEDLVMSGGEGEESEASEPPTPKTAKKEKARMK